MSADRPHRESKVTSDQESSRPGSVLVTGASGLIGAATVAHLLARGERVVALDQVPNDHISKSHRSDPALLTLTADATLEDAISDVFDQASQWCPIDRVVHLAARANMAAGTPAQVFGTNVVSTFTVLAIAAHNGVRRAVIASSIHATGLLKHHRRLLPDRFPIDESQAAHLDDWYALSKNVDELSAGMVSSRWGLPVVALRFPLVQRLDALAETAARNDRDPERSLREGWTYLPVSEAARAIGCALDAETEGALVVHLAAPDTLLSLDTEEALQTYAPGVARTKVFVSTEAPMDTSRAATLLGFTARSRHDLAQATDDVAQEKSA